MGFIARHCLVYGQDATRPSHLDFSVEETWNCPPMPTYDFKMRHKFLTQPKPALAVCFKREELILRDLRLECLTQHGASPVTRKYMKVEDLKPFTSSLSKREGHRR